MFCFHNFRTLTPCSLISKVFDERCLSFFSQTFHSKPFSFPLYILFVSFPSNISLFFSNRLTTTTGFNQLIGIIVGRNSKHKPYLMSQFSDHHKTRSNDISLILIYCLNLFRNVLHFDNGSEIITLIPLSHFIAAIVSRLFLLLSSSSLQISVASDAQ